jgi:hypothetical protein
MKVNTRLEGLDELNAELRRLIPKMTEAAHAGIHEGVLIIQGKAQKNAPFEYGDLVRSAYTNKIAMGAEVGFEAAYALYVHENMEQKLRGEPRPSGFGTYWNPGGPKFLERAVNEHAGDVVKAVVRRVSEATK